MFTFALQHNVSLTSLGSENRTWDGGQLPHVRRTTPTLAEVRLIVPGCIEDASEGVMHCEDCRVIRYTPLKIFDPPMQDGVIMLTIYAGHIGKKRWESFLF